VESDSEICVAQRHGPLQPLEKSKFVASDRIAVC